MGSRVHIPLHGSVGPTEETVHRSLAPGGPRIGPNSVLQTLRALEELEGVAIRDSIESRLRLPKPWPEGMIPEAWFTAIVAAVRADLPPERAEAVLRKAGQHTAEYVALHRIPKVFHRVLAWLPARWAVPLLLSAFKRHAWTFAGGGRFSVEGGQPYILILDGAPTCRAPADHPEPGGAYYEAAFEGLLSLASKSIRVTEVRCVRDGASACRFVVQSKENKS